MNVSRILFLSGLFLCAVLHQSVLIAADQWDVETIVDGYRVGEYTSLEIMSSGEPAICYYDYSDGDLEYSWFESDQWWTETIDSEGDVGSYTSLMCLPNGHPAVSYIDKTNSALKYAWFDGEQWHQVVVDENAENGYTCLRQLPTGYPAISYAGENCMKYAWYDGLLWYSAVVDPVPVNGGQTSMTMVGDRPFITYYDGSDKDLKVAHLSGMSPEDPNSWLVYPLDTEGDVGFYNSIATSLSDSPVVCYYDKTNQDLKYASIESSTYGLNTWQIVTVDAIGDVGKYCSLKIIPEAQPGRAHAELEGCPVISYFDNTNKKLTFTWFDGNEWQHRIIDSSSGVGRHTSLNILPSGEPAVSYSRTANGLLQNFTALRYASFEGFGWLATNVEKSVLMGCQPSIKVLPSGEIGVSFYDWVAQNLNFATSDGHAWNVTTVDNEATGMWSSLAVLPSGFPAISHTNPWGKLKYTWYDGENWQYTLVDTSPSSGLYTSLGILPATGQPCISYTGNDDLCFAWHDGSTWHSGIVIDGDGDVGYHTSLTFLPSGKPAVSYWDKTNTNLKYAELIDDNMSDPNHWKTQTVDSVKDVGEWTSLCIWGADPAISYYDKTNRHLKFAWRTNGQWQTTTIDTGLNTGECSSLAIVAAKPAVSFRSQGDLKYMELIGSDPANPLDWKTSLVDTGGIIYSSLASYGGHPAIAYFDDAHGDLKLAFGSETN